MQFFVSTLLIGMLLTDKSGLNGRHD